MSHKLSEDERKLKDVRMAARKKVRSIRPNDVIGNVVCCLDQNTFNIDLRNLAVLSRRGHSRLQALLRHYEIPKGEASKKFALWLKSEGMIEMIHPIKKEVKKPYVIAGFKM